MSKVIFFLLLSLISYKAQSQQERKMIAGQLLTADSLTVIPYVSIKNLTLKQATISNEAGYFQLPISSFNDSIVISSFEYNVYKLKLDSLTNDYTIYLEPKLKILDAISVRPTVQEPLIDLLSAVRKNNRTNPKTAKSYFFLRTFHDSTQIELIEGYYNLDYKGYDIEDIHLKAGRLGLTAINDRYFSSHNGVKAITEIKALRESDLFPSTPLSLKSKDIRQQFHLILENKFIDENGDSVWIINYNPKQAFAANFTGKIWINQTKKTLKKMTLECSDCQKHPFNPMFAGSDSLANLDLKITKTFRDSNGKSDFEQVDLSYSLDYFSRKGTDHERNYSIRTNAVLYVYDYDHQFTVPYFSVEKDLSDYRKINAYTYNPFFWNNQNEFAMNQQEMENQRYYSSPTTITNSDFFKTFNNDTLPNSNLIKKKGIAESQFVHWSADRIIWRDLKTDSTANFQTSSIIAERYNLDVQFFMDWNKYNDSINVLTDVVFNPYKSYYYLPIDARTNCFINMYFDLCEVQRRQLQLALDKLENRTRTACFDYFKQFLLTAEKERQRFLTEVDRGTNDKNMEKWNRYLIEQLNIDNLHIFLGM